MFKTEISTGNSDLVECGMHRYFYCPLLQQKVFYCKTETILLLNGIARNE